MSGFSHRGCIFDPRITDPWFPRSFPPHSVYYGNIDYLVLGKPLIQRIQNHETNMRIVHAVELEGYEHLDMIFGIDAWRTVFPGIKVSFFKSESYLVSFSIRENHFTDSCVSFFCNRTLSRLPCQGTLVLQR